MGEFNLFIIDLSSKVWFSVSGVPSTHSNICLDSFIPFHIECNNNLRFDVTKIKPVIHDLVVERTFNLISVISPTMLRCVTVPSGSFSQGFFSPCFSSTSGVKIHFCCGKLARILFINTNQTAGTKLC